MLAQFLDLNCQEYYQEYPVDMDWLVEHKGIRTKYVWRAAVG